MLHLFPQVTGALLALDPFVWPLFGLALTTVGILLRKLRGLKPSAEQAIEPVGLGLFVFAGFAAEVFGVDYGIAIVAALILVFAVIYSAILCAIRVINTQWTTLAGSITTLGFLVATMLTMNIRYADWETIAQTQVRDSLLPCAALAGAVCAVMCLVELVMGLRYRIRLSRALRRLNPPGNAT